MTKSAIWRLTRKNVEAAMRRKLPEGRISDGQGLYLFIRKGGLAQWTFRKMIRGKNYELLIGNVVDLGAGAGSFEPGKAAQASLDEARRKTAEIVNHLNKGGSLDDLKRSKEKKAVEHTWADLKATYIKVKGLEGNKTELELNRHIKRLQEIAPEALSILDFTKDHARKWRDERAKTVEPDTIVREMGTIKSMYNTYFNEFDIDKPNPFTKLTVTGKSSKTDQIEKRSPFTIKEVIALRTRVHEKATKPMLPLIVDVLAMTGARLNEILKLRIEDVFIDDDIPHIFIRAYESHNLKTTDSRRRVPLYGVALEAVKKAVEANKCQKMLFGEYGEKTTNTSASAVLMKHVRTVTEDDKKVLYSLRHTLVDVMRGSHIPRDIYMSMFGHTAGNGISDIYGTDTSVLSRIHVASKDTLEKYSKCIEIDVDSVVV